MTTAKPPARYGAIGGARPGGFALPSYTTSGDTTFKIAEGTRVEYCGPPSLADLLARHLPSLKYDVVLRGQDLKPLLRVALGSPGETQLVAGYRHYGKGLVFYLPSNRGNSVDWASYIDDASKLADVLLAVPSELPAWIDQYQTDGDKKAFARIGELTLQAAELNEQLETQHGLLARSRELKRLIFGTGGEFANAVAAALTELGLAVVEGPHPRADFLVSNGSRCAAIEAKGVDGPTREKDVRQTVQWMAEVNSALASGDDEADPDLRRYAEQLAKLPVTTADSDCKGLLIMGTFRKQPLNERTQPSFPEPVVRVLERVDVCALTGLQLLGLILQVRDDPSLRPTIVKELFDTRGVLQRARDWIDFLDPPPDANP